MPGIVIKTITSLAYIVLIGGIIYFVAKAMYILYERKKKNDALELTGQSPNFLARLIVKVRNLAYDLKRK